MLTARNTDLPLTRRMVEKYLLFALAGLLTCLIAALWLAWRGTFTQFTALVAFAPLAVLLLGAAVLRRSLRLHSAIEQQLYQLAAAPTKLEVLQPVAEPDEVANGWNTVCQQVRNQSVLMNVEQRLRGTADSGDSRRWETLFHSLSDGVAVCDGDGIVTFANNALAALLARPSPEQLRGQPLLAVLQEIALPEAVAPLERWQHSGSRQAADLQRSAELSAGVWRIHRIPLAGECFDPQSSLWTLRDVTQQKLAEEMRNQFVYTATHELRTPLANIIAYADTLSMDQDIDVERRKGFFNIINAEATRLARFVDELLNVSQMEAGSITAVRHETDVDRLLKEVCGHVQPQLEQKQQVFELRVPAKLPSLQADKDKLTAALVNLVGNAIKYTPPRGEVRLQVEVSGAQMHFHVEDTGIGIAAEELPRVGDKFFRSRDPRVQGTTGSGLGLAFCQEVARLHGGRLDVHSEPDRGSRFTLSLPLL